LRRIRATIFAVKNKKYYIFRVCIFSLRYPACNADAPYYIVICGLPGSALLFHITSSMAWISKKKIIAYKMRVLIFSTTFVWNIRLSKKSWDICDHKRILVFMYSARYPCQIFINLAFSRLILEKYSNIRFHDSPSSGSIEVPCGRTDRQTDMTWCFSDRASWIYCILFNNFCALIIIYS